MLYIIIILVILFIAQTIYLHYYRMEIKNISKQLGFIIEHQSFKFLKTDIRPNEIMSLINNCNAMLESSRELNQRNIERNEMINQTIVSLSHDIRTPLTSLDGYLQLAMYETEENKYISMAASRVKQLNKLVDELFLYTKLQNPDYEFELEPIELNKFIKNELFEFVHDFQDIDKEPMIKLSDQPLNILAHTHALERIIDNVVKNYFTHGRGNLVITHTINSDLVTVIFKNDLAPGIKIDSDNLLTKFYKTDRSRSEESSGLGLSIVNSLMRKMNGSVVALAEDDEFIIKLTFKRLEGGEST